MQFHSKIQSILNSRKDDLYGQIETYLKLKAFLTDDSNAPTSPLDKIKHLGKGLEQRGIKFIEPQVFLSELNKQLSHIDDTYLKGLTLRVFASAQGFKVKFVKLGPQITVQSANQYGDTFYFSVHDGSFLSQNEILDLLNISPDLEELTYERVLWSYLEDLTKKLESQKHVVALLKVYSAFLHLNETYSQALLKRALIYAKMGLEYEALSDLKRFLQFQPKSALSEKVLGFYKRLSSRSDDTPKSMH